MVFVGLCAPVVGWISYLESISVVAYSHREVSSEIDFVPDAFQKSVTPMSE
jgi:hypothetical protein